MVLPEQLCERLTFLAEQESRTVSNMAKVLIQEGIEKMESENLAKKENISIERKTDQFRSSLESQPARRLRGAPKRIRIYKS